MRNTILIILLVFASCGTRKTSKSEENLEATKKDTTTVVINTGKTENKVDTENTKVDETTNWNFSQGTASPIDPDKPMTHTGPDGKTNTYTNTKIDFVAGSGRSTKYTETTRETKTETKDTSATKINSGAVEEIKKNTITKNTDRKGTGGSIGFWIGIAIATCIVIWFLWFVIIRRRKQQ